MRRPQSSTRRQSARERAEGESQPPRRRFGQNFLVDPSAIARVASAIDVRPGQTIVEIGPGRGALTDALIALGARIVAIEIDRGLATALRLRHDEASCRVIEGDVLGVPLASLGRELVVAGNLPYNISKPVAMKLVDERAAVARAVLMFQREVAMRLTARAGTAEYGPLTVLAGRCFTIERVFDLPPGAFRPRPEVTSTLTRWTRLTGPGAIEDALVPALKAVLRASFARRRQTLQKNLRLGLAPSDAAASAWLEEAGLPGGARAETIPPEGFVALAAVVRAATL